MTLEEMREEIVRRMNSYLEEINSISDEDRETFESEDVEDEWHSLGVIEAYDAVLVLIDEVLTS